MIDINLIRTNPESVKTEMGKKKCDPAIIDSLLKIDEEWRSVKGETDTLRAEQKNFGANDRDKAKEVKSKIVSLEERLGVLEEDRNDLLNKVPNLPESDVPVGRDDSENVVVKEYGKPTEFSFTPKDYLEIAGDCIDTVRAGKIAGSRFGYIMGEVAELESAMFKMAIDTLVAKGFRFVLPPVMIRGEVAKRMGKSAFYMEEGDSFKIDGEDMYLVASSEHSMIPMYMDETVDVRNPIHLLGYSTCFRREAGSYGKDTKGILRVHQFNKLEMNILCRPEESKDEHEFMLSCQEELVQKLGVPYRVVKVCTGDMGFSDARQYDVEMWIPSQEKYRESHSCSNTTDFQARGLNIGYKKVGPDGKEKRELVHTLNATAFPERPLIAMLENFQNEDGSVTVPVALRPYMAGRERILAPKQ
jgi:seryl-tRNA synthetase